MRRSPRRRSLLLATLVATGALGVWFLGCSTVLGIEGFTGAVDAGLRDSHVSETGPRGGDGGDAKRVAMDAAHAEGSSDAGMDACPNKSDFTTDPNNCGSCGHDCLGGACVAGACQPVVIASGLAWPITVAVDNSQVYWTELANQPGQTQGRVMRAQKNGADASPLEYADRPYGLAVDGTYVYWDTASPSGVVVRMPRQGGAEVVLAPDAGTPSALAVDVDAGLLFWVNADESGGATESVHSISTSGTGEDDVLTADRTGSGGMFVAFDSNYVYFAGAASEQEIRRVPRAGCPGSSSQCSAELVSTLVTTFAVDGHHIYWADIGTGTVQSASKSDAGKDHVILATMQTRAYGVMLDDHWLYWTRFDSDGGVLRVEKDGSSPSPMVMSAGDPSPSMMTADQTAIYWVRTGSFTIGDAGNRLYINHDGAIVRLAK